MKIRGSSLFTDIRAIPAVLDQKLYPSLNGIRGVAVLMVVIAHMIVLQYRAFSNLIFIGSLGVNIFFVLSGFLITTLCIKEKIVTGTLSLKKFYIRRALRILPVAYLYIGVIIVLNLTVKLNVNAVSILSSALFAADFSYFKKTAYHWDLGHYWSLAVEEQFYLIFPVFIKKSFYLFVGLVMFILFVLPVILYLQSANIIINSGPFYALTHFLVKFQAISLGCFFSVLCFKGYLNFGKLKWVITLACIAAIFFIKYDDVFSIKAVFVNLFLSVLTGFIIVNSIYTTSDVIFKFFNFKPLATIGILSYSIYIWQQLFVSNDEKFWPSLYPFNIAFLIVVPCISYYFYESFFLRLKTKFMARQSTKKGG
ncbi:acyltransferase [Mucilaginibacter sp. ZT4R22]|uniref:Acyltransferase n=1 Tax=Mucilaginibacter pankratovii TaxID=2772110 RepID=A0ABR7WP28_9SPHI|nr:acyltransferase [Mucilaginibacter pankratovii]MBD1363951.1 acyltransferase [Mucilaginibacter pankratovii]